MLLSVQNNDPEALRLHVPYFKGPLKGSFKGIHKGSIGFTGPTSRAPLKGSIKVL